MIHNFAGNLADTMVKKDILNFEKRDYYAYSLEVMIEKIITYSILIMISIFMHVVIPTIFFMVFFFSLRERTGGYHLNSFFSCLIGTLVIYISMITVISTFLMTNLNVMFVLLLISSVIIMYIGNINHENLNLSEEEVRDCKASARFIVVVEVICIVSGVILDINRLCIVYQSLAIIMCAILLFVAKMIKQEV